MLIERGHYNGLIERSDKLGDGFPEQEITVTVNEDGVFVDGLIGTVFVHDYRKGEECPECNTFTPDTNIFTIGANCDGTHVGTFKMCRDCFAAGEWAKRVDGNYIPF
jgi:hypothetical protein